GEHHRLAGQRALPCVRLVWTDPRCVFFFFKQKTAYEMILTDQQIGGQTRKLLTHFDRNGLGYTLDRDSGELLVAEKFDPTVNWTSGVDMNKSSPTYGRPKVVPEYSTEKADVNHNGISPTAL